MARLGPLGTSWEIAEKAGILDSWLPTSEWVIEQLKTAAMFAQFPVDASREMGAPFPVLRVPEDVGAWYRGLQGEPAERLALAVHLEGLLRARTPSPRAHNPRQPSTPKAPRVDPKALRALALRASDVATPPEELDKIARSEPKLRVLVASNPTTPPSTLHWLATGTFAKTTSSQLSNLSKIQQAVAVNPNASVETLEMLAGQNYTEVFENVSLGLFRLTHVGGLPKIDTLEANRTKDASRLEDLSYSIFKDVRYEVASNRATPPHVLKNLSNDPEDAVKFAVAVNPSLTTEIIVSMYETYKTKDLGIASFLSQHPSTPPEILREMYRDISLRHNIAKNRSTPLDLLEAMSRSYDGNTRAHVGENRSTPPEILARLTKDNDNWVQMRTASNPNTPLESLHSLARTNEGPMLRILAGNIASPVEILRHAFKSAPKEAALALVQNPNTPPDILRYFAQNGDDNARTFMVRNNASVPVDVLALMLADKDVDVREGVANHPQASIDMLMTLVRDKSPKVREAAKNALAQRDRKSA